MKKLIILSSMLCMFVLGYSQTKPSSPKFWGIDQYNIGVISGNTIKVYWKEMYGGWSHYPKNIFTIPANTKSVFMHMDEICVYNKTNGVTFYQNIGPSKWSISKNAEGVAKTFKLSKDYDRAFSMTTYGLAFVQGKTVDFYTPEGELQPTYQFIAPDDALDFFAAGTAGIVVANKDGIDLYTLGTDMKWTKSDKHLDYPEGYTGLIQSGEDFVGFVKNKSVVLYYFGQYGTPSLSTTFTLPK